MILYLEQALRIDYFQNLQLSDREIDIEVDIEIVDITISDMVDTSSVNTVDDYSTTGV